MLTRRQQLYTKPPRHTEAPPDDRPKQHGGSSVVSKQSNGDSLQIEQTKVGWRVSGAGQVGVVIAGLVGGPPLILIVVSLFFGLADHPWALVALSAPVIIGQIAALTFVLVRMLDQRHEREMAVRDQLSA